VQLENNGGGKSKKRSEENPSPRKVVWVPNSKTGLFPTANNHGCCYIYSLITLFAFSATFYLFSPFFLLRLRTFATHHNGHQYTRGDITLHAISHSPNAGIVFRFLFLINFSCCSALCSLLDLFITRGKHLDAFVYILTFFLIGHDLLPTLLNLNFCLFLFFFFFTYCH